MNSDPNTNVDQDDIEGREAPPVGGTSFKTIIMAVAIAGVIFAFDLMVPLGVAGGMPYVVLVLFGLWFEERSAVFFLAVVGSLLTNLGYFFSPEGGIGWVVFTNRTLAMLLIWATAIILWWTWRERTFRPHPSREEKWYGQKTILSIGREGFFVSILAIVIGVSSWGVISRIEESAKADIGKALRTALETSHVSIRNRLDGQKNAAIVWANNAQIKMAVAELSGLPTNAETLLNSRHQKSLRAWMTPALKAVGYRGFFVIGKDNINLASSRESNVGIVNLLSRQGDFLERVWAGETLISLPQVSDVPLRDTTGKMVENLSTMFVATPIKGAADEIISILAFRIEPDESFTPIFERGRFGKSGETYAFDRNGLLISESRFNDRLKQIGLITTKHSDLSVEIRDPGVNMVLGGKPPLPRDKQPLTRMALSATNGENGLDLEGYRDYRGVPVVGAWLWDDELRFGIATKVNIEEAFASFNNMRLVIFSFTAISIGVLIVLAVVSSHSRKRIALSEERLRRSVLDSPIPIILHAEDGEILMISNKWVESSGYSHSDIPTISDWTEKAYGADKKYMKRQREAANALYNLKKPSQHEACITTASGEERIWEVRDAPLGRLTDGRRFVISMAVDVTEQKQAEKKLREGDELLENFVNHSPSMFSLKDLKGRYLMVSEGFGHRLFHVEEKDIKGKSAFDLLPKEAAEAAIAHDRRVIEAKTVIVEERKIPFYEGSRTCLITKFPLFDAMGEVSGVGGISTDITERKQAEDTIKASLAEKEVLLKEIHHRVKNNLQVISGMLWLQANAEDNAHTAEVLQDSYRRVMLMAQIHENLHRQDDINFINAREFLNTLVSDTKASGGAVSEHLSFHVDVEDISLDVDHANAYGQIVSELISNCQKHGYVNGSSGNIEVSLRRRDGGVTELIVADDGKGLPEDFDLEKVKTLGLYLVRSLAAKLGGKIKIDRSGGTRVEIDFPENPS